MMPGTQAEQVDMVATALSSLAGTPPYVLTMANIAADLIERQQATIERLTGALAAERACVRADRSGPAPHDQHWKAEWRERTRLAVNKWRKKVTLDSDKWQERPRPRGATRGPE